MWMEMGGVYATNLRGLIEVNTVKSGQAGTKLNKQRKSLMISLQQLSG